MILGGYAGSPKNFAKSFFGILCKDATCGVLNFQRELLFPTAIYQ
jgi:hypothetical protein